MKIITVLFLGLFIVGCETSAKKSVVTTTEEGKESSVVIEHVVKTDLPVEEWTDKMIEAANKREERKAALELLRIQKEQAEEARIEALDKIEEELNKPLQPGEVS